MNTLFDILTDKYSDVQPVNYMPSEEELAYSIRAHLIRLLNTRQGSIQHLPDYGLPDLSEIFQGLPHNIVEFINLVKICLGKYEPRLQDIHVKYIPKDEYDCVLCVEIYGKIRLDKNIKFTTFFLSGGRADIN